MISFIVTLFNRFSRDTLIYHKLITAIILMIAIPLICLSFVFYYRFHQIIEYEVSKSFEQVVDQYQENVKYKMDSYRYLVDDITGDSVVQDVLARQNEEFDIVMLSKKFQKEIGTLIHRKAPGEVITITVYALNDNFPTDGNHLSNVSRIRNESWFQDMEKSNKGYYFHHSITPGQKREIISIIKPIYNFNGEVLRQKLGYVKVDISTSTIFRFHDILQKNRLKDIYILDGEDSLVYKSNPAMPTPSGLEKRKNGEEQQIEIRLGSKVIAIHRDFPEYGWRGVFFFPYDEIQEKVFDVGFLIISTVMVMLIVLIALTILFSKTFSNRIMLLIRKMKSVRSGDIQAVEAIGGNDEIGILDQHFNSMIGELRSVINEKYIAQLERKDAELTALQSQINPHFLFNTLETVNSMASVYGIQEIGTICHKLSEMFRYSINIGRNEFVTLEDELTHIENYIAIQSIRFEDMFEVYFDIPDRLRTCKVLKFILQPIVENALYHGFDSKQGKGFLEISARRENGMLTIRIQDDGKGMTEEQAEKLNAYINEAEDNVLSGHRRSIGIKNVNTRIKLTYGDSYGITIHSVIHEGTQVRIVLPMYGYREGEDHVQGTDCG